MHIIFRLLYLAFCLWVIGCTVHYFYCLFYRPTVLYRLFRGEPGLGRTEWEKKYSFCYMVSVWLGVGFCIYAGIATALFIRLDSNLGSLIGIAAFFGSFGMLDKTEEIAIEQGLLKFREQMRSRNGQA